MTTKTVLYAVVILAIVAAFLKWESHRDQLLLKATDEYEKCIAAQYHMMPYTYYAEHGSYPECNPQNHD